MMDDSDILQVLFGVFIGFILGCFLISSGKGSIEKRGYWYNGDRVYKLVRLEKP